MKPSQCEDWDALLDRLSACITPEEAAAVRQAAVDRGSPSHLRQLHNHVALLLVKHGLTTWPQLHTSFPEHHGNPSGTVRRRQATGSGAEREGEDGAQESWFGAIGGRAQGKDPDSPVRIRHRKASDGTSSGLKRKADDSREAAPSPIKQRKPGGGNDADKAQNQDELDVDGCSPSPMTGGDQQGPRGSSQGGTLADYPSIVGFWHPAKNGTNLPADYSHASWKRVWLQCPGCPTCGEVHQWDACGATMTQYGGNVVCPACSGSRGSLCSCRAISASACMVAEWHEENPPPTTVHQGSQTKYKWRCADAACGHVWEAQPRNYRHDCGSNCPKCARNIQSRKHPSVAVGRPELLDEWDEKKNTLLPTGVSLGSNLKVWWLCKDCGNSWEAPVHVRALKGCGCRQCNRRGQG